MKRRLWFIVLLAALALGLPVAAAAQDDRGVWDLSQDLTFTDLGFKINFPADWVFGATESSGVFFAENDTDLAQVTDDDANTLAKGNAFQIIGTPIDQLAEVIGTEDPTLDQLADFVVNSRGITEKENRVEVAVMSRRSIAVIGEDQAQQGWILSLWKQGDFAIGAFLVSPSFDETVRISYSWGQLLGLMQPNDQLPLSKTTIPLPSVGAEFNIPEGWTVNPNNDNIVYELESDLTNDTNEGYLLVGIEQTPADLTLAEDATLEDAVQINIDSLSLVEPVRREEFLILGQPAITIRGTDGSGQYVLLAQAIIDGQVVQIGLIAPDETAIDRIEPTFIAMLQSLHSTKTT